MIFTSSKTDPAKPWRKGVPSLLYWLADRLEVLRTQQLAAMEKIDGLQRTHDLLIEYHVTQDERIRYMQRTWDELVADVAALKDLPAAVKAGFDALEAKLAAAFAAAGDSPSVDEVNALKADIEKAVADVKAAIPA